MKMFHLFFAGLILGGMVQAEDNGQIRIPQRMVRI